MNQHKKQMIVIPEMMIATTMKMEEMMTKTKMSVLHQMMMMTEQAMNLQTETTQCLPLPLQQKIQ